MVRCDECNRRVEEEIFEFRVDKDGNFFLFGIREGLADERPGKSPFVVIGNQDTVEIFFLYE